MEREAFDADEVADVEQFLENRVVERRIAFGADVVAADVDLNAAVWSCSSKNEALPMMRRDMMRPAMRTSWKFFFASS